MSTRDLHRRLDRIEAQQHVGAPVAIVADGPMTDAEGAAALSSWRELVTQGRATVSGSVLWIVDAHLPSPEEWTTRHTAENSYLQ